MTLVGHLTELRRRLIVSIVAVGVGAVAGYFLYTPVLHFLLGPYRHVTHNPHAKLLILDPLEGLTVRLRMAAYIGLFVASPVVLWQVWRFITPGLNPNEKRYAVPFIVASILLFALGAVVALLTFQPALQFLKSVGGGSLTTQYTPSKYLRLITLLILAFGVAFEFPVVLVALELAHIVSSHRLRRWRRQAIVLVTAIAAFITPTSDPISMLAMAVPMYLFYEAAIVIGRIMKR